MTKSRHINTPRFRWQPWQEDILRCTYASTANEALIKVLGASRQQIYSKAGTMGLKKSKWFWTQHPTSSTTAVKYARGESGRFSKGHIPFNKGRKGLWFEGADKSWFKKGHKPANKKPIGTMRKCRDGYYEIKLFDTGVKVHDWVPIHRMIYERMHGIKIPKTHVVIYLDGDYEHWQIENLRLITKAENCQRNSVHNYPIEIAKAYQLVGQINRQINKRSKQYDTNS